MPLDGSGVRLRCAAASGTRRWLGDECPSIDESFVVGQWFMKGGRSSKPLPRGRLFSSATKQCDGAVSMVQGASRGIGLQFVTHLLEKSEKGHVVATCCNPDGANQLLELKKKFPQRLDIHRLDLTVDSTIEATAKSVQDKYGYLNLLTILDKVERSSLLLAYEINALGPILVIKTVKSQTCSAKKQKSTAKKTTKSSKKKLHFSRVPPHLTD